ncbi:hypothetical protein [Neptuniibacter sp. QD37_11]|uniref:hypothetical protein n=1 Tax=Neptuniibacter sp. QD37_11 TaxID=3398209 RepID=UPI0039F5E13D
MNSPYIPIAVQLAKELAQHCEVTGVDANDASALTSALSQFKADKIDYPSIISAVLEEGNRAPCAEDFAFVAPSFRVNVTLSLSMPIEPQLAVDPMAVFLQLKKSPIVPAFPAEWALVSMPSLKLSDIHIEHDQMVHLKQKVLIQFNQPLAAETQSELLAAFNKLSLQAKPVGDWIVEDISIATHLNEVQMIEKDLCDSHFQYEGNSYEKS